MVVIYSFSYYLPLLWGFGNDEISACKVLNDTYTTPYKKTKITISPHKSASI